MAKEFGSTVAGDSVTEQEVAAWKLQRGAEKEFWKELKEKVDNLELKIGNRSTVVKSMRMIMRKAGV